MNYLDLILYFSLNLKLEKERIRMINFFVNLGLINKVVDLLLDTLSSSSGTRVIIFLEVTVE